MNKFVTLLCNAFILMSGLCFAESLSMIPKSSDIENHDEMIFELNQNTVKKFQAAAKFLSHDDLTQSNLNSRAKKNVETFLVSYETLDTGISCHVGWYQDVCIATALDGTEQGKQVVVVNNTITGISYDVKVYKDRFEHKYTWGTVCSYPYKQIVKFK